MRAKALPIVHGGKVYDVYRPAIMGPRSTAQGAGLGARTFYGKQQRLDAYYRQAICADGVVINCTGSKVWPDSYRWSKWQFYQTLPEGITAKDWLDEKLNCGWGIFEGRVI